MIISPDIILDILPENNTIISPDIILDILPENNTIISSDIILFNVDKRS